MGTLSGTTSSTGATSTVSLGTEFNLSLDIDGVSTVALERSFDAGTTWFTVDNFTKNAELVGKGAETATYRFNVISFGYGTITYRLSDGAA